MFTESDLDVPRFKQGQQQLLTLNMQRLLNLVCEHNLVPQIHTFTLLKMALTDHIRKKTKQQQKQSFYKN